MGEVVECLSTNTYAKQPKAFYWQGKRLFVEQIVNESRLPDGIRFLVKTQQDCVFELLYNEYKDSWKVIER